PDTHGQLDVAQLHKQDGGKNQEARPLRRSSTCSPSQGGSRGGRVDSRGAELSSRQGQQNQGRLQRQDAGTGTVSPGGSDLWEAGPGSVCHREKRTASPLRVSEGGTGAEYSDAFSRAFPSRLRIWANPPFILLGRLLA